MGRLARTMIAMMINYTTANTFWQNVKVNRAGWYVTESKVEIFRMFCLLHRTRLIGSTRLIRRNSSSPSTVEYQQGQSPEPKVREYFYYIDHEGMVRQHTFLFTPSDHPNRIVRFNWAILIFIAAIPGRCTHQKFHIVFQGQAIHSVLLQATEIQRDQSLPERFPIFVVVWPRTEFHSMRWLADCVHGNIDECRYGSQSCARIGPNCDNSLSIARRFTVTLVIVRTCGQRFGGALWGEQNIHGTGDWPSLSSRQ